MAPSQGQQSDSRRWGKNPDASVAWRNRSSQRRRRRVESATRALERSLHDTARRTNPRGFDTRFGNAASRSGVGSSCNTRRKAIPRRSVYTSPHRAREKPSERWRGRTTRASIQEPHWPRPGWRRTAAARTCIHVKPFGARPKSAVTGHQTGSTGWHRGGSRTHHGGCWRVLRSSRAGGCGFAPRTRPPPSVRRQATGPIR